MRFIAGVVVGIVAAPVLSAVNERMTPPVRRRIVMKLTDVTARLSNYFHNLEQEEHR